MSEEAIPVQVDRAILRRPGVWLEGAETRVQVHSAVQVEEVGDDEFHPHEKLALPGRLFSIQEAWEDGKLEVWGSHDRRDRRRLPMPWTHLVQGVIAGAFRTYLVVADASLQANLDQQADLMRRFAVRQLREEGQPITEQSIQQMAGRLAHEAYEEIWHRQRRGRWVAQFADVLGYRTVPKMESTLRAEEALDG